MGDRAMPFFTSRSTGLLLIGVLAMLVVSSAAVKSETQLQSKLLAGYDFNARPVKDPRHSVKLTVQIALQNIQTVDQLTGDVQINIWLRQWWKDEYLTWNATEYPVEFTTFPTDPEHNGAIWIPDLMLYHSSGEPLAELSTPRTTVYANGNVFWSRPGVLRVTHKFQLTDYPFDEQEVMFKLGSWAYDEDGIQMIHRNHSSGMVDLGYFKSNAEWRLLKADSKVLLEKYSCCPHAFPSLIMELHLKRNQKFYQFNLIVPPITIVLMGIFSFGTPWDGGERASLMSTSVLTLTVYSGILIENMPFTDDVPWFTLFILALWFYSIIIFVLGIVTIRVRTSIQIDNVIPGWLWKTAQILRYPLHHKHDEQYLDLEYRVNLALHTAGVEDDMEMLKEIKTFVAELEHEYSYETNMWAQPAPKKVKEVERLILRLHHLASTLDSNHVVLSSPISPRSGSHRKINFGDHTADAPAPLTAHMTKNFDAEVSIPSDSFCPSPRIEDTTTIEMEEVGIDELEEVNMDELKAMDSKGGAGTGAGNGKESSGEPRWNSEPEQSTGAPRAKPRAKAGETTPVVRQKPSGLETDSERKERKRSLRRLTVGFDGCGGFNDYIHSNMEAGEEDAAIGRERDKLMFVLAGQLVDNLITGAVTFFFFILLLILFVPAFGVKERGVNH